MWMVKTDKETSIHKGLLGEGRECVNQAFTPEMTIEKHLGKDTMSFRFSWTWRKHMNRVVKMGLWDALSSNEAVFIQQLLRQRKGSNYCNFIRKHDKLQVHLNNLWLSMNK